MGNDLAYDDEHLVISRTSTIFGFGTGKQKAPYVFSHNIYTTMTVCLEAILKYDPGCAIQISSLV